MLRGSNRWLGVIAGATLAHRAVLHLEHRDRWLDQLTANPGWLTMQFMPAESLLEHPWASLWYLQGMPPVPNGIVALALRLVPSSDLLVVPLLAFQALLTAAAACLTVVVGRRWLPAGWAWALGILWAFSPDPVVLEATNFGQAFYENLTLVGLLVAALCVARWTATEDQRWLLWLGLVVALVALTRSSYAYLFVPVALTVALAASGAVKQRLRAVALTVCFPILLQGGWALKNAWVYDHFTWPASTWAGASMAGSLRAMGLGQSLENDIRLHLDRHAPWMRRYVDAHGTDPWADGWVDLSLCPEALRELDAEILQRLGRHNRHENTSCQRVVSEEFAVASVGFLGARPDLLASKLHLGYSLYWHPMRYHHYLALAGTEWRVERPLRFWRSLGLLLRGDLPEPHYLIGNHHEERLQDVALYTLDLPVTVWWIVEVMVLHLVTPFVLLSVLVRAWRRRRIAGHDRLFVFLSVLYAYAATVHNAVEFGENMRFRWNVEPLIWLLVAASLVYSVRWLRRGRFADTT
ncbi:MAG: hypothetical protein MPN21_06240 [Thermoanaerobaculia bacterium]|nr:hypothetical protein [Thermoanaerobaculia bacterium]